MYSSAKLKKNAARSIRRKSSSARLVRAYKRVVAKGAKIGMGFSSAKSLGNFGANFPK